ncbi:DUF4145 domain-containing protein (plasmid) [Rhizobium beringeri]|jgi:hypothetical protein|nr:DUF4145 domain-containing protein [Rhizobium beringeri]WSH17384.1 DUF4145 domain-containing protein [Rhizobium beringeri]
MDDLAMGDFVVCDCSRCGRYKITGSALATLPDRLESHDSFAARLSHAVRTASDVSGPDDSPVVTSMNLDQLGGRKLPSIEIQISNLLNWMRTQVGDDQMEAVEIEDRDILAGVVGAVDGNRVDDLLDLALQQGVVEFVPDDCWKVTIEGWRLLEAAEVEPQHQPTPETPKVEQKTVKVDCNECGPARNAHVRASYSISDTDEDGTSWSDTWEILECCGCNSISARRAFWFSERDTLSQAPDGRIMVERGVTETFYPGRTRRKRPVWTQKLSDPVLSKLVDELYKALAADLLIVSSICARTLFDAASTIKVGDAGNFKQKIAALVAQGMMSVADKEAVEAMTDAGNASAHRGYEPSFDQLMHIVDIVEGFIERQFYYPEVARSLRSATPSRPGKPGSSS